MFAKPSAACAQSSTTCLLDIDSRQPIHFATLQCVSMTGKVNAIFATSDQEGRVSACSCEGMDSVKWKIRHLSYLPIDTILSCQQQAIDTIWMYPKGYEFGEVIVSGKNEGVRVIGDSIRFDLSVFRKPHHRDLKDLLNDLPGIHVTENGYVEYKGKPVGQILLRGKSTGRSQFDLFNRVIKKEDLSTIQLTPDEPEAGQFDRVMNLDLVLKPDRSLLGQIQSQLSNQGEIGSSASIIRSGDTRWNHAAEAAFSQIANSHRPRLHELREFYDDSYRFKRAVNIKGQRPKPSLLLSSDRSEKDQVAYAFYNALYEGDRSEINLYTRYRNHISTRLFEQTHFNVNTSQPLWTERSGEDAKLQNSLFSMSWKHNARKNLTLRAYSYIAHDINMAHQKGVIELAPSVSRLSQQHTRFSYLNATLFAHAIWQIDSSWTWQTGIQVGTDDNQRKYDLGADSVIYDFIVHPNSEEVSLRYNLDRKMQHINGGAALQRKWNTLAQQTAWVISYNATSMSEAGDLEEIALAADVFRMDREYATYTTTSLLTHEMTLSKIYLTAKLGGHFFQSDQLLTGNHNFKWSAATRIRYTLKPDQFAFLGYTADAKWLDESYLWRTARPVNLQSYTRAGHPNPAVIRNYKWSAGWKEFSPLSGSFSQTKIEYQYKPIHYEWRQQTRGSINVDTLVEESDFNEILVNLRTSRKIRGVRFSTSLAGRQSHSRGKALFADQKLKKSDLTFRLRAGDILRSKTLFISLRTLVSRRTWRFGNQSALPPQWNSESTIQVRLYIKKLNGWIASEATYLWRGNIYNETLVSGSIEKKWGGHFMLSFGVENLFNLNANVRRNRVVSAEAYRESEQTVFGGRIYLKVRYQL